MRVKAIDLLRIGLILLFGGISIWLVITLFNNSTGWLVLLGGLVIGVVGTEVYYVPIFREKWQRKGVPGYRKTEKQQKAADPGRDKNNSRIIWIVIVGIIGAALWRNYLSTPIQNLTLIALLGSILGCLLRFLGLIYQEGNKLER